MERNAVNNYGYRYGIRVDYRFRDENKEGLLALLKVADTVLDQPIGDCFMMCFNSVEALRNAIKQTPESVIKELFSNKDLADIQDDNPYIMTPEQYKITEEMLGLSTLSLILKEMPISIFTLDEQRSLVNRLESRINEIRTMTSP